MVSMAKKRDWAQTACFDEMFSLRSKDNWNFSCKKRCCAQKGIGQGEQFLRKLCLCPKMMEMEKIHCIWFVNWGFCAQTPLPGDQRLRSQPGPAGRPLILQVEWQNSAYIVYYLWRGEIPVTYSVILERKRIKEMKGFTVFTVFSGLYVLYLSLLLLRSKVHLACENTPIKQRRK